MAASCGRKRASTSETGLRKHFMHGCLLRFDGSAACWHNHQWQGELQDTPSELFAVYEAPPLVSLELSPYFGGGLSATGELYWFSVPRTERSTTQQAAEAGYSPQLLVHHIRAGRMLRIRRGDYRLVHFPAGEHEELVAVWLWSEQAGVFSHETALALHGLSDVLPAHLHLTLPTCWKKRRFRVPEGVMLHHADLAPNEQAWIGSVPTTSVTRTLNDVARGGLSPELLRQAAQQALRRGLTVRDELVHVEQALEPFGGLAA